MPQILYTFLESYNFSNKNIYIFSSHGGSGLAGTPNIIKSKLGSANVNTNALTISRDSIEEAPNEINEWLRNIGMIK